MNYTAEQGEAAFYGPKIDFVVRDCIGREWQLGTVQLDYNLPKRFELEYIGTDNKPHRPVMIHRAPFGSMERFMGILIEHFAGAFPLWLAPEQVRVLPISERFADYGKKVEAELRSHGFRVSRRLSAGEDRLQDPRSAAGEDPVHAGRRREGADGRHGRGARPRGRRSRGNGDGGIGATADGRSTRAAHSSGRRRQERRVR